MGLRCMGPFTHGFLFKKFFGKLGGRGWVTIWKKLADKLHGLEIPKKKKKEQYDNKEYIVYITYI